MTEQEYDVRDLENDLEVAKKTATMRKDEADLMTRDYECIKAIHAFKAEHPGVINDKPAYELQPKYWELIRDREAVQLEVMERQLNDNVSRLNAQVKGLEQQAADLQKKIDAVDEEDDDDDTTE